MFFGSEPHNLIARFQGLGLPSHLWKEIRAADRVVPPRHRARTAHLAGQTWLARSAARAKR